ncbi:hypothetical protein RN001_011954 [Aquatica leii]|uniref:Retrotransposon gag domain-containing protein n=1 Tax=Aquatica leii TaxID=1421715 RepID=A0AAN7P363_9COLE|nr:hypothetical protein RN001_011954 [Aquatica leii]
MVHKQVLDWDSLVSLMKQEFTPSHSADILWKQILNRTQGANESIGIYVATMTCLFDRMPISVSNELRLKVLRDINTTTELINYCRKLEETKLKVKEFKPPQEGQLTLEPDLDYNFIIWFRYVYDMLILWLSDHLELSTFFNNLNNQHVDIKFTMEMETNVSVSFFSVSVICKPNGLILFSLSQTPSYGQIASCFVLSIHIYIVNCKKIKLNGNFINQFHNNILFCILK